MKSPGLMAILFMFVTVIAYGVAGYDDEWINILMAGVIGYLFAKVRQTQAALEQLRSALSKDWEQRQHPVENQAEPVSPAATASAVSDVEGTEALPSAVPAEPQVVASLAVPQPSPTPEPEDVVAKPGWMTKLVDYLKAYFTTGNIFVRIGVLVLFFGVSFLLKHFSDSGLLPIEYRLIGVAVGGFTLLAFGWRLRDSKPNYARLLQGAGIGVLYLDVFAAFSLYTLLPPLFAFTLLVLISLFAATLAVLQNTPLLAVLGFSGGFLAPILASSGSGDHVALLSYYAILNIAIALIAWFRAWRVLNVLGFAFTFVIASFWGFSGGYSAAKFASTEPFLVLFLVLYIAIAVLYALRQPPKLSGYVDGSLVFGVPVAFAGLQYSMLQGQPYWLAFSALLLGALYIVLSKLIWQRFHAKLGLLAEAFLVLGIIFISLAVPFALSPNHSAAMWALEGVGLLWLGNRQQRLSVRIFGLLLQVAALGLVAYGVFKGIDWEDVSWLSPMFMSWLLLGLAAVLVARILSQAFTGRTAWEAQLSGIFLGWGVLCLYLAVGIEVYVTWQLKFASGLSVLLVFSSLLASGFAWWAWRTTWQGAVYVALLLQPLMWIVLLLSAADPFAAYAWLGWLLGFGVLYLSYSGLVSNTQLQLPKLDRLYATALLLLVALVTLQGSAWLRDSLSSGWHLAWLAVPSLLALNVLLQPDWKLFAVYREALQRYSGAVLIGVLLCWGILALLASGDVAPLPWVLLLNPVDILLLITGLLLWRWYKQMPEHYFSTLPSTHYIWASAAAGFVWLNMSLFRFAHHWAGLRFDFSVLLNNSFVQTAISILWALAGVVITGLASKYQQRVMWMAGSALLGLVVVKLFLVDLSQLSHVARILSFLVVGALLIGLGYFAPLPTQKTTQESKA